MLDNVFARYGLMIATVWCVGWGVPAVGRATTDKPETAPRVAWIRQFGAENDDEYNDVAVDIAGNVYVAGRTEGSLGGPNAGLSDILLAKYDEAGTRLWTRQIGTEAVDVALGTAVDGEGNVYLSGYTQGSLAGRNAGDYDVVLLKYNSAGTLLWSRQIGSEAGEQCWDVTADKVGNVYITGATLGNLGWPYSGGGSVSFLAKYDATGSQQWIRPIGSAGVDASYRVAADGAGNVYVTGDTMDGLGGVNGGSTDVFLAKYDATGTLGWLRQVGSSGAESSYGVAADAAGNVWICGYTTGNLAGPLVGQSDSFLIKFTAGGGRLWSRQFNPATPGGSNVGVAIDSAGNAYVGGYTGPTTYLAKYNAGGILLWLSPVQNLDQLYQYIHGVALDGQGNAYIPGGTFGDFGGTSAGGLDAFLIKFGVPEPSVGVLAVWGVIGVAVGRRRYD